MLSSLCHTKANNSLKTDKYMTKSLHSAYYCSNCSHIFSVFRLFFFCDRVSSTSPLFSFSFLALSNPTSLSFVNKCLCSSRIIDDTCFFFLFPRHASCTICLYSVPKSVYNISSHANFQLNPIKSKHPNMW